ncbi:MAG TPA: hypothetical protein VNG90_00705 [Candidatus Acidoferrum sp.]|nr:hypothetical protein [Candidatus Acidoferrum sp.]
MLQRVTKFAFDFDDTMNRFFIVKLMFIEARYGVKLPPEFLKKTVVEKSGVLTLAQYETVQEIVWGHRFYTMLAEAEQGMVECLTSLLDRKANVSVVTSRDGDVLEWAKEWLANLGLSVPTYGVGYGKSKAQVLREIGAEVFVDDDWPKLNDLVGVVPHIFRYSRPFNQTDELPREIRSAESWWWLREVFAGL